MVTKADLLAGFTEYFADLDFEGRRAVLGATLPFKQGRASADDLAKAFDRMAQSVTDRQAKRLYEEPDSQRRSLILGFPAQLQSLRARLMRLDRRRIPRRRHAGRCAARLLSYERRPGGRSAGSHLVEHGRCLRPPRPAKPGRRRRQGLFPQPADDRGDVRRTRARPTGAKGAHAPACPAVGCDRRRLADRAVDPHRVDRQLQRQPQVPGRDAQCGKCNAAGDEAGRTGSCRGPRQRSRPRTGSPCARCVASLPHGYEESRTQGHAAEDALRPLPVRPRRVRQRSVPRRAAADHAPEAAAEAREGPAGEPPGAREPVRTAEGVPDARRAGADGPQRGSQLGHVGLGGRALRGFRQSSRSRGARKTPRRAARRQGPWRLVGEPAPQRHAGQ